MHLTEEFMKYLLVPAMIFGLAVASGQTFADDAVSTAGKAQQQKIMAECMKKQSSANSQMTKDQIQKRCDDEIQAQKDANDKTPGAAPQS
jgi:hypothetical protein